MVDEIDCVSVSKKENFDLIPEDISLEQYWEEHNEFLNAWDEGPTICLAYRSKYSGKKLVKRIEDFEWYFHVRLKEYKTLSDRAKNKLEKLANRIVFKLGKDFVKIYCDNESINQMYDDTEDARIQILSLLERNGVEALESDLKNYKRYCIDKHIKIAENFKIAFFDIETDDRNDGIIIGRDRILSFAYYDQDGKGRFKKLRSFDDESEYELLLQIEKVLLDFDIIITWNGNNFDIPYIKERFKKIVGRNISLKTVAHIDFMKRFQKLFQSDVNIRSWSLNFISNYFLGDQKVDHTGYGMYDMWQLSFEDDPKTKTMFRSYNMHDCKLLYRLEEKLNILSLIIKECQWTGTFPSKFYVSELLDNYILRFSNPKGVHFKSTSFSSKSKEERKKESEVQGGFVYDPDKGLHENVYVFDFKSLYPTIVMTFNISQDTFHLDLPKDANELEFIKTINGHYTYRNKEGMLPIVINQLLEARKEYKQKQFEATYGTQEFEVAQGAQQVVKELANSMYGTLAQVGNRYYSKETAEAITLAGQHMNKYTGQILKKLYDYDVKYGDSVSPNTCIPVKLEDNIHVLTIKEFFEAHIDEVVFERGKEIIYPCNKVETLSGKSNWKKVVRIIRHKIGKKLYDVVTPDGIVSVTSDHSFYSNGRLVSPDHYPTQGEYSKEFKLDLVDDIELSFTNTMTHLNIYDSMLKFSNFLTNKQINYYCEKVEDKILVGTKAKDPRRTSRLYLGKEQLELDFDFGLVIGGYIAEGSISKRNQIYKNPILFCGTDEQKSVRIYNAAKNVFGKEVVSFHAWDNCYRVKLNCAQYAMLLYQLCGYSSRYKQMPDFVLNTNKEFVRGIFVGYSIGDGLSDLHSEDMSSGSICGQSRKFVSQANFIIRHYYPNDYYFRWQQFYDKDCVGFSFRVKSKLSKHQISAMDRWEDYRAIYKKDHKASFDGYVYDIEVEDDHTFIDAAGGAILHNTDSVFVHMPDSPDDRIDDILEGIHKEYVKHLTEDFNVKKSHIQLEYEKKFKKIILLHKKQYVGWLVEVDSKPVDKIYGRGIEYVKKDTIELARRLQYQMLTSLLKESHDVEYYHKFVQDEKEKFLSGNFDVSDILINMKVSKKPENYKVKQVHIRIAEQMIKDGKEFYVGSMIPFIITSSDDKLDGIHVDDFKGEYDRVYYWDIKIFSPLKRILSCVFPNEDWLQYEFDTVKKRNRKMEQFSRWLQDKSKFKRREEYIERIKKDTVLSTENKEELLSIVRPKKKVTRFRILRRIDKKEPEDSNGEEKCQMKKVPKNSKLKLVLKTRKPPQIQ